MSLMPYIWFAATNISLLESVIALNYSSYFLSLCPVCQPPGARTVQYRHEPRPTYNPFCVTENNPESFTLNNWCPVIDRRFERVCKDPSREAAKIELALGFEVSEEA
jgi:hypothetical protein